MLDIDMDGGDVVVCLAVICVTIMMCMSCGGGSSGTELVEVTRDVEEVRVVEEVRTDDSMALLFLAVCQYESGMVKNVTGSGKEYGLAQIGPEMFSDYVRSTGDKEHTRAEVYGQWKIFSWYMGKYGRDVKFEELPRLWNGGPKGCEKDSTLVYCERVMNIYYKLRGK